jgi:hypothetical protein
LGIVWCLLDYVPSKISAKNSVLAPLRALREIVLPRIHELFYQGENEISQPMFNMTMLLNEAFLQIPPLGD